MVRLVSMFLNYSALESGKLVLQLRENDLARLPGRNGQALVGSISAQRRETGSRSLIPSIPTFRFRLPESATSGGEFSGQRAEAHADRRERDVESETAFLGTARGGSCAVRGTRRFRLPRPNSVEVSVTDSGAGIAAEHHQEIFEDFVRVDRNTSGMGLGLAIAKRLIQAHRGKIWVESERQQGSTFRSCCRWISSKRF